MPLAVSELSFSAQENISVTKLKGQMKDKDISKITEILGWAEKMEDIGQTERLIKRCRSRSSLDFWLALGQTRNRATTVQGKLLFCVMYTSLMLKYSFSFNPASHIAQPSFVKSAEEIIETSRTAGYFLHFCGSIFRWLFNITEPASPMSRATQGHLSSLPSARHLTPCLCFLSAYRIHPCIYAQNRWPRQSLTPGLDGSQTTSPRCEITRRLDIYCCAPRCLPGSYSSGWGEGWSSSFLSHSLHIRLASQIIVGYWNITMSDFASSTKQVSKNGLLVMYIGLTNRQPVMWPFQETTLKYLSKAHGGEKSSERG